VPTTAIDLGLNILTMFCLWISALIDIGFLLILEFAIQNIGLRSENLQKKIITAKKEHRPFRKK
jgi:hypothetical protein